MNNILSRKKCTKCKERKSLSDFHKDNSRKDKLFPWCKSCVSKHTKAWYLKNDNKVIEYGRKWRKENPDKKRAQDIKWRKNNIQKARESGLRWFYKTRVLHPRPKNPFSRKEMRAKYQRDRNAREKGSNEKITAKEWQELKEFYNYTCLCCKKKEPEIKLTLDHVVPLALGGAHSIKNSQPLCKSCNCRKNVKYIDYR